MLLKNRATYINILYITLSGTIAFTLPKQAIENGEISSIIVTIFSVFAGFMIALMALTAIPPGHNDWKKLSVQKEIAGQKLLKQQFLFLAYLSTLALIIASKIIPNYDFGGMSDLISLLLQRAYIFIALVSLFISFSLPSSLKKAHEKIFEEHIENTKNERANN